MPVWRTAYTEGGGWKIGDTGKLVTRDELRRVADRLTAAYPYIEARKQVEGVLNEAPLDSLIRTILSQNTTDRNRDRAFASLRAHFANWEAVADAAFDDLTASIVQTNHAPTKAMRMQAILRQLRADYGHPTLDFLREWPTDRILDYLESFPGVGPKSAAIVCLFALQRPVLPVDTHVHRVVGRLGWIGPRVSAARAHILLRAIVPAELVFRLHVGLWEHGRVTCRPHPRCGQCAIYADCIYPAKTAPEPPLAEAIAHTAVRAAA